MKLKINVFKKNKGKKIDPDMTCTSLDSPRSDTAENISNKDKRLVTTSCFRGHLTTLS